MIPSLSAATTWLNQTPISVDQLRGKVVLVDFWTYTCINWRRTLPYLRAWNERYGTSGLFLIGVHSPEFSFEHDLDNVRQMTRELGVNYPVAVDSAFAIWNAFGNDAWPALYLFDARGQLRHTRIGEDGYEETDRVIRQLLAEAGEGETDPRPTVIAPRPFEERADWDNLRSPENYLGFVRTLRFSSPGGLRRAEPHHIPSRLGLNAWALSGTWTVSQERAAVAAAGGRIAYRFHARDLHLVMAPETRGKEIHFRILLDGKAPGIQHGVDVDGHGMGVLREQRLYQLIRQAGPISDRLLEIEFLEPGAAAYSFTFG